jgi:membrane protein implicated in regulation of membrane protease activity
MPAPRATPSSADVAMEVSSLSAGLGIITTALFPFALPALVLVAPLALVPVAGLLVAAPVLLPLWLARRVRRGRSRRRRPLVPAGNEIRTAAMRVGESAAP